MNKSEDRRSQYSYLTLTPWRFTCFSGGDHRSPLDIEEKVNQEELPLQMQLYLDTLQADVRFQSQHPLFGHTLGHT